MRSAPALTLVLLLAPLVAAPTATADEAQGATVGANLGYVAPGLWDVWHLTHAGGGATLQLSWEASLFPGADYDLHLYQPGALDDGVLLPDELVAQSSTRTFAPHVETIAGTFGAGTYALAVVPFQTQAELYTLETSTGSLAFAAIAPGFVAPCPPGPC